jgi:hypothetical protein
VEFLLQSPEASIVLVGMEDAIGRELAARKVKPGPRLRVHGAG